MALRVYDDFYDHAHNHFFAAEVLMQCMFFHGPAFCKHLGGLIKNTLLFLIVMKSAYLPVVSREAINAARENEDVNEFYDLLAQPLHEELYRRKTFDFLDELSDGQQLLLAYDYARMQVGQGGFIQFIENGYISLLPSMIEQLYKIGADDMARVMDDVLKVYVLNRELLSKPNTVEEFAQLYDELKEFEGIDGRFGSFNDKTVKLMLDYAFAHLDEFVTIPS